MDLETYRNIAAITAPLTKVVLETFLIPKFKEIKNRSKRKNLIIDHAFENKFHDYLNEVYEKNAVLNTLAFKKRKILLNEVYLPLTIRCQESNADLLIEDISANLFTQNNKILITDTAGMGKSTISRKLLVSSIEENFSVPILIELRRLSENKGIIDEILEQINPINETIDKQFILDLIKRGDFIFFFDGFDEISIPDRARVTKELQLFISKASNNKFILTSRPEDALSSFGDFRKFQIKPLKTEQAFELLGKYDNNGSLSKLLISKIKEPDNLKNIEEYLDTPLLVSLLFTAFEHKQRIPFKKHIFYRQVFDALYESHDLSKGDSFERDKYSSLGIDEFHRVLRILGYLCLTNENKIEFNRDQLNSLIQKSLEFCNDLDFKPSDFIKDLIITVPLFVKDGIYYKWSHKSLQEYFAAQFIYLDSKSKQKDILNRLSFHEENQVYLNVIDLYHSIDPKGFQQIVIYNLLNKYQDFTLNTYSNFTGEWKSERQEFQFGHEIYLINFKFRSKTDAARELFNELIKQTDTHKRVRIMMRTNEERKLSYIKVPEIKKPEQILIEFLFSKGEEFIHRRNWEPTMDEIELTLQRSKVYPVGDRKNAFINKGENFKKTNELIKHYIGKNFISINRNKYKKTLNEIEQSISQSSDEDFLLSF